MENVSLGKAAMNSKALMILTVLVVLAVVAVPTYAGDAHPNFSPDDSRLVYMSDGEVEVVEIGTGKVTNLTNSHEHKRKKRAQPYSA